MKEKQMRDLEIGQKATFIKTLTEADITLFAGITGDFNRIHVDQEYANSTQYGKRIAHGFLVASLVQPCMSELTTPGGVSMNYNFNMKAPVFIGDTITASAEIIKKREDKPIVTLKIQCLKQDNTVCISGEALIYMVSDK
ncbi:MAG: enoyl-CoA hydratase [Candidatus Marinimicrobia bacterium]|nr:enoyl-CoA hydratase [Candidatus Neomarinimicrobiota bacterium]